MTEVKPLTLCLCWSGLGTSFVLLKVIKKNFFLVLELEILNLFPTEFCHKGIFNMTFKACQCVCAEAKVTHTVFKMQR